MKFETKLIHSHKEDKETGAVVPAIYETTTYSQEEPGKPKGYDYTRTDNPTRKIFEDFITKIENGKHALVYSSGMAAINNIFISLLKSGDGIISCNDIYGGTYRSFENEWRKFGIDISYVDMSELKNVRKAINDKTRLIFIETPTNPLLKLTDLEGLVKIAKSKKLISAVDNTFASPYNQKPLVFGVDIVVESTTKYINGHSTVIGGALAVSKEDLYEKLKYHQNAFGAVQDPIASWLNLMFGKTLALRMKKINQNALRIAQYLENNSLVEKVYYPGLKSHPQHELAKRQMRGYSGIVSFELKKTDDINNFLTKLKYFTTAESLGGIESLIEVPALMTHASIPKETREKNGISDYLIRVSVGIEHVSDLIKDLSEALKE
ncbi:MAG: PLP-dependent aspartate aminotransferase family protein [Nanoarchaeota archaeon]|nr:PLP-dependent aspartate aminotransferase family protein [Nanoarchaeota archaeon]